MQIQPAGMRICTVLLAWAIVAGASGTSRSESIESVTVFLPGELGYPCIRIPSLLLVKNVLLAFAECRNWTGDGCAPVHTITDLNMLVEDVGEQGLKPQRSTNRDLCMKRSDDGGATWGTLSVIARDACQPTPVWDEPSASIVLNFNRLSTMANMQMRSLDVGQTWTTPTDLTSFIGPTGPYDVGPGTGIRLTRGAHPGRILFIGHHDAYQYDRVWYSDDGGVTYTLSQTPLPKMDEAQLAELPDGTIYATLRNNHANSTCFCQGVARSTDGGVTFSSVTYDPALITPVCQAALLAVNDTLYFANPASTTQRVNGIVRSSRDGGRTWPRSFKVTSGPYAYSCLSAHPTPSLLGLLWERDMNPRVCIGPSCQTVFSVLPGDF